MSDFTSQFTNYPISSLKLIFECYQCRDNSSGLPVVYNIPSWASLVNTSVHIFYIYGPKKKYQETMQGIRNNNLYMYMYL